MSLIAQLLLGMFSPSTRHTNPVYRLFEIITSPVRFVVRKISPSFVLDQHIPLASLFLLVGAWFALVAMKARVYGIV